MKLKYGQERELFKHYLLAFQQTLNKKMGQYIFTDDHLQHSLKTLPITSGEIFDFPQTIDELRAIIQDKDKTIEELKKQLLISQTRYDEVKSLLSIFPLNPI